MSPWRKTFIVYVPVCESTRHGGCPAIAWRKTSIAHVSLPYLVQAAVEPL